MTIASRRRAAPALVLLAALALCLIAALPGFAQQGAGARLIGRIAHVQGDTLSIRTADGKTATVILAPDASVALVVPARLSDIKTGRFVGTAARPEADGRSRAIEVHIFPVGSRLGEGHRPWQPEAGATMTNADVTAAAVHAGNGVLTLTTGGQNYDIDVPPGTPIVAMKPGTRALIKTGAHVVINQALPGADGSFTTKSITVTTARNWPPK